MTQPGSARDVCSHMAHPEPAAERGVCVGMTGTMGLWPGTVTEEALFSEDPYRVGETSKLHENLRFSPKLYVFIVLLLAASCRTPSLAPSQASCSAYTPDPKSGFVDTK